MDDYDSSDGEDSKNGDALEDPMAERTLSFQLGTRSITAIGSPADHLHVNVLRLEVSSSPLSRFVRAILPIFPAVMYDYIRSKFPEWTIPEKIVVKKQKDGWEDEFDTEKATYQKLRHLHGQVIPAFFGQIDCDGTRALVLSDVGGTNMSEPGGALLGDGEILTVSEFRDMLSRALRALAACDVSFDDLKLDNFLRVDRARDSAIMIVDLEQVSEIESEEDRDPLAQSATRVLTKQYAGHVQGMQYDGVLPQKGGPV